LREGNLFFVGRPPMTSGRLRGLGSPFSPRTARRHPRRGAGGRAEEAGALSRARYNETGGFFGPFPPPGVVDGWEKGKYGGRTRLGVSNAAGRGVAERKSFGRGANEGMHSTRARKGARGPPLPAPAQGGQIFEAGGAQKGLGKTLPGFSAGNPTVLERKRAPLSKAKKGHAAAKTPRGFKPAQGRTQSKGFRTKHVLIEVFGTGRFGETWFAAHSSVVVDQSGRAGGFCGRKSNF